MDILVVEDNVVFASVLRKLAASRGHACAVATTVSAAVEALETHTFDAVIVDLHVGRETGLAVLQRAAVVAPTTRRVLMSGTVSNDIPPNVDARLVKPFSAAELQEALEPRGHGF